MRRLLCLLLCALPLLTHAAEPLGRLFLTPAERAALDIVRQNSNPPEKIVKPDAATANEDTDTTAAPLPVVTIGGYVKRSDGKGTVWVNGQPVQERNATKDIEVDRLQRNTNDVRIKLQSTGQTIRLKAGQSYDPASDKVMDNLAAPQHDKALSAPTSQNKPPAPTSRKEAKGNADNLTIAPSSQPGLTPPPAR